jgi:phage terminase large subunit
MSFEAIVQEFIEKYGNDPVSFVKEVLGIEPDPWQEQVLRWVGDGERRISVRSGHGVGKSSCASWVMVWHLLTRFPQKAVVTAPTINQLQDALAAECKRWVNALPVALSSQIEVLNEQIRMKGAPSESFISFRVSRAETPEALAGVHSEHVLLIADEASGVPEGVFEAASGSMSGESACTLLFGNPVRSTAFFYNTHTKLSPYWKTLKVSCVDSPRVADDYVADMKLRYGDGSNAYRVRVLGEFPIADDDTIIPRGIVESAIGRDVKNTGGAVVMGVDVARKGLDKSSICIRQGNHILGDEVMVRSKLDTMQVVGWVQSEINNLTSSGYEVGEVLIDSIGLGAGVVDRLIEKGVDVRGINVSEAPSVGSEFFNLRSELWWKCKDWFERRDCKIPRDEGLIEELVVVQQDYNSDKLKVEPKEKTRKNLEGGKSPDKADALILTFASYASMSSASLSWNKPLIREIGGIV